MKTSRKFAVLALGLALVAAAAPFDAKLKSKDHKKLGKLVHTYYESVKSGKGLAGAKNDLAEAFEKHNGKISKKVKQPFDLLSSSEDMSGVFAYSKVYPKVKGQGKLKDFASDTPLGEPVEYVLHAPKTYKASKGALPLVLVIPDEGEAPDRHLDEDWMLGELRNGVILAALQMPEDPDLWAKRGFDELGGLETVMFAMRSIKQEYAIDADRIFIAGHGSGVAAAAEIANMFPYIFAGVIGRAGDLGEIAPTNFRNLNAYFSGGGSRVSTFSDDAIKLEYETVTVDPTGRLEDVWSWIQATSRNGSPATITFAPTSMMGACYWLTAKGYDLDLEEKPSLTAEIDRDKNVIAITSKGISQVTLMLNDSLVDLDREVRVICNGVDHTDQFDRSLTVALTLFYNSNDSGRIYSAYKVYDLANSEDN